MGRDKARLPFRGGHLAGAVAAAVAGAVGNVTLVGHPELPGIPDLYPGQGPLGGILSALTHSGTPWSLIAACDLPEVSVPFLSALLERAMRSPAAVVLPAGPDGRPQPLCALYHQRARVPLEDQFARGVRRVGQALAGLEVEPVRVGEIRHFHNVNTPEDWVPYAAK